ncbi:MAG: hypothetical protein SVO01_00720 [Thermotogota bacterium]|nr:hypothetical protein [Thermotogota bacterium]
MSDQQILNDINEVLEKNLPAHLSKALQNRLNEADKIFEQNKSLKDSFETVSIKEKELKVKVNKLTEELVEHEHLDQRQKSILMKELNQELFEAKTKLEASEMVNSKIINFVALLMRNVDFRKEVFKNHDQNWCGENAVYTESSRTETTHKE